jgi:hypothetical protein
MRLTMLMVLSSSLAFAQNAGQMQAKQDMATHNLQGAQQSAQFQQMLNSSVNSPFTPAPRLSPKPGTFQGRIPTVSITDDIKGAVIYAHAQVSTVRWPYFLLGNDNAEGDSHCTFVHPE